MADPADSRPSAADLRDAATWLGTMSLEASWDHTLPLADRLKDLAALWTAYEAVVAAAEKAWDAGMVEEASVYDEPPSAWSNPGKELGDMIATLRAARGASTHETRGET